MVVSSTSQGHLPADCQQQHYVPKTRFVLLILPCHMKVLHLNKWIRTQNKIIISKLTEVEDTKGGNNNFMIVFPLYSLRRE